MKCLLRKFFLVLSTSFYCLITVAQTLSPDGDWLSYFTVIDNHALATIKNIKTGVKISFPCEEKIKVTFSADSKWTAVYFSTEKKAFIMDLTTGARDSIHNVINYQFTIDSKAIIFVVLDTLRQKKDILLKGLITSTKIVFPDVAHYSISDAGNTLATISGDNSKVSLIDLKTFQSKQISSDTCYSYSDVTWSKDGRSIVFFMTLGNDVSIGYYNNLGRGHLKTVDVNNAFFVDKKIDADQLLFTDDGATVYFYVTKVFAVSDISVKNNLTIQYGNVSFDDDDPYGAYKASYEPGEVFSLCSWNLVHNGYLELITTLGSPRGNLILNVERRFAIVWKTDCYRPFFREIFADFYYVDLNTGIEKLILSKFNIRVRGSQKFSLSPNGISFAYYKDDNWWIINLETLDNLNITADRVPDLYDTTSFLKSEPWLAPYGISWTSDSRQVFIYDRYDIWISPTSNALPKRITNGREQKITFRLFNKDFRYIPRGVFRDVTKSFIVSAYSNDTKKSGFYLWSPPNHLMKIYFGDVEASNLITCNAPETFMFSVETVNRQPELMYSRDKGKSLKNIGFSDPVELLLDTVRTQLLNYTTTGGIRLQGVLYFPTKYESDKKYPMIVEIYEKQSDQLHRYISSRESLDQVEDIDIRHFTSIGYFVFKPDIVQYKLNNPGVCAFECVTAGVTHAVKSAGIDTGAIGIMGHSHGGLEVNYIITQTNMFSAAIAMNAFSDLFLIAGSGDYRTEMGQGHFAGPVLDNFTEAMKNSPIYHIGKIKTPLLLETGDSDDNVPPIHSELMFNFMRRMGKKVVLLKYKGEYHALERRANKVDYKQKMEDWFNHFLKKTPAEPWLMAMSD